jgi:molybdopterin converting factor small subunit
VTDDEDARRPGHGRPNLPVRSIFVATLRLFASVREAAGTSRAELDGASVDEVLAEARCRFGRPFTDLLTTCRVWVNGEPADGATPVGPHDEVAVLPPVSGGT